MTERNEGTLCSAPQLPSLQKEETLPFLLSHINSSVLALHIPAPPALLQISGFTSYCHNSNAPRGLLSSPGPLMLYQPLLQ